MRVTRPQPVTSPLFLVGAPRSGTSLLYKALCLHPAAGYISNWVRRFPALPQVAALNRVARRMPATQRSVWFGDDANAYVYGRRRSLADRVFPMPVEGEPLLARCGLSEDVAPPVPAPATEQALRRAFTTLAAFGGGQQVICKRIANNRRIPQLRAAFPGARFVELVRDGRAVAYSLSRVDWWPDSVVWWYGATPRDWAAQGGDPWELCARSWVRELGAIENGLASVPPEGRMRITYEEFTADPVAVLERVARFSGLPHSTAWVAALGRLRFPDRNDAWRKELDDGVGRRIELVQREDLVRQGYVS